MQQQTVEIINKLGLHARAAAKLAQTCGHYSSTIRIQCDGQNVDGKSIMSLMLLAASQGTTITVRVEGDDEHKAIRDIINLIADRFGEEH